jgi:sporulation protein YlmC with PRC-barrel domain
MDKYYTETIGLPIITTSGDRAGNVFDIIINPENGKLVGLLMAPSGGKVLAPLDIIYWNDRIEIHSAEDILEAEEIQMVHHCLKKNIRIYGNKVMTKSGEYLGRVIDFAVHNKLFVLTRIVVAKSVFGLIKYNKRIIAHKDILEIKRGEIIVKDPLPPVRAKATAKLSVDIAPTT